VTENGVATFDNVIYDWRETSLVCNFDITDVILPYLMPNYDADISCRSSQASSARMVHVSAAHRKAVRTSAVYVRILMVSDKRRSRHIFDKDAITDEARANWTIRFLMSDRHWPSRGWTLTKYTKLSTRFTRLPSTVQ